MAPPSSDAPVSTANVSKVAVKPPPFWKINPSLWFIQLEAQFTISGITQDDTKFYTVVSAIEPDILNSVSDIVSQPPSTEKYKALKERLIEIHSESQESKIRKLLQGIELGDQRPSQLLSRMRSLAGSAVGEPLLKSLWLARLPNQMQSILAALSDDLPQLAAAADKINEMATGHINAVMVPAPQPLTQNPLELQVAQLTKELSELKAVVHRRNRSGDGGRGFRNRSRSQSTRRRYREPSQNMCFYHTNFGSKARKCNAPCSFASENSHGDRR